MREQGNIWPITVVVVAATLVLVIAPLIIERQRGGRMATVDAQVSIGDVGTGTRATASTSNYRWPDSEVPRTAERLRDVTGVTIASTAYMLEGLMKGSIPHDAGDIATGITRRGLVPSEWLTDQAGVLKTPHATIHLRYSPRNLTLEFVSLPNDRLDGPGILIRVPDTENTGVGLRYFESATVDGIAYPEPFAPIALVIASGWQPRLFKQTQMAASDREQLEQWVRAATRK